MPHKMMVAASGIPTAATISRLVSSLLANRNTTKSAIALLVIQDGPEEILSRKIGP